MTQEMYIYTTWEWITGKMDQQYVLSSVNGRVSTKKQAHPENEGKFDFPRG